MPSSGVHGNSKFDQFLWDKCMEWVDKNFFFYILTGFDKSEIV
jgi:hypothetical protein